MFPPFRRSVFLHSQALYFLEVFSSVFVFPVFVEKGIYWFCFLMSFYWLDTLQFSDMSHNLAGFLKPDDSCGSLFLVHDFNVSSSDCQCHTSSPRTWHPSWSLFCPCCLIWASTFDRCVLLFCLKYSLKLILPLVLTDILSWLTWVFTQDQDKYCLYIFKTLSEPFLSTSTKIFCRWACKFFIHLWSQHC